MVAGGCVGSAERKGTDVRALVIGGGSIGARHLRNLRALGVNDLALVEPDGERLAAVSAEVGAVPFAERARGLDWKPDLAIVATPSHLHVEDALAAAHRGCHLFIEKPLSHSEAGLDALAETVAKAGLVSIVGCNMRFHPGPAKVKELLFQQAVGRLLFSRVHTGSYLPGWRPHQDYRAGYSASADMGGGCILDCIHEIDLARWYGGEVTEVFCESRQTGALEIDVEDYAALICRHVGGVTSEVHLDYVSRTYERGCHLAGEKGSIFWDFAQRQVRLFTADDEAWTVFAQPEDWEANRMYLDEMQHFLRRVETGETTALPVAEGVRVTRLAFAAKKSAAVGTFVSTGA